MTGYDVNLKQADLVALFTENDAMANLLETFAIKAQRAMNCLESGLEDALSVLVFLKHYRKRLRTTNLAERMNEEIRRRQRVIRVFPNNTSALRLIGALLRMV